MKVPVHSTPAQILLKTALFVAMLVLIVHLYPRPYESGKTHLSPAEREATLQSFSPYFNLTDPQPIVDAVAEKAQAVHQDSLWQNYLHSELLSIYARGVLAREDILRLEHEGYSSISIVNEQHVAHSCPISDCHTPRMAYSQIMEDAPEGSQAALRQLSLASLLTPNLQADSLVTAAMQARALEEAEQHLPASARWQSIAGNVLLASSMLLLLALYLWVFRPALWRDNNTLLFFALLMAIIITLCYLVAHFTPLPIYVVPFAWIPVITRVFYDSRTALYVHLIATLICAMMVPNPSEFLVVEIGIGMVAVSSLRDMAQRSQLVQTAGWILLAYCVGYTGYTLALTGDWHALQWQMYPIFVGNALLIIFAYGLIYLFEKTFHLLSSITLVELTNINSGLMLEFAEKAPGTFQHSLQVSSLAMEAAREIGANALLVRTGGLYHDIGKMARPEIYTENQQNGLNPLATMEYIEASQAVITHVTEGVEMARQHHLPSVIEQFILTHHGTSKTRYFFTMYQNAHPEVQIDERLFQYPGPRPDTKETAILMMADAVEARSRSLHDYSEESIRKMVNDMIGAQMADGQFEDTPLTLRDIRLIKQVFVRKLISMNHHRIAYPELKK